MTLCSLFLVQIDFQAVVGTQLSAHYATTVAFTAPAVTTVSYPVGGLLTAGGDTVTLGKHLPSLFTFSLLVLVSAIVWLS